jgi:hypothetical protein
MRSDMRALLLLFTAVLGSLYGTHIKSSRAREEAEKQDKRVRFCGS